MQSMVSEDNTKHGSDILTCIIPKPVSNDCYEHTFMTVVRHIFGIRTLLPLRHAQLFSG